MKKKYDWSKSRIEKLLNEERGYEKEITDEEYESYQTLFMRWRLINLTDIEREELGIPKKEHKEICERLLLTEPFLNEPIIDWDKV